ncbi:hypothetical protein KKF84_13155 [Myxococcota bacterium]|nr:hypothetical protein [Myxococcota bacterium]MBU1536266.1 hypothetical protein [Myxococcota bacterium]
MILLILILLMPSGVSRELHFERMESAKLITGGRLDAAKKVLSVKNGEGIRTIPLFSIKNPPVTTRLYQIRGKVKYKDVRKASYLEMMNFFPGNRRYFTRTMAGRGPLQEIKGSSGWREFSLPFDLGPQGTMRPDSLTVSMVFFSKGAVWLKDLEFIDGDPGVRAPGTLSRPGPKPWWSPGATSIIGALWGSLFGLFGVASAVLIQKGRGKRFVLLTMVAAALLGLIATIVGVIAYYKDQPYDLYFPILLVGVLSMFLAPFIFTYAKQHYTELELRKMKAQDLASLKKHD